MSVRAPVIVFSLSLLLLPQAYSKNKKRQSLPDYVLKAEGVFVVIYPDAGEPLADPAANQAARDEVEKAIMAWGRFEVVPAAQTADLVIAVRKGHAGGPTIRNSPTDNPPVTSQQIDAESRVVVQVGRPPDLTDPGTRGSGRASPQISNQVGPSEDTMGVYRGGTEYPLDAPPIWRFTGKDSLRGPQVVAVKEFQKAITEAEKQRRQNP